MATRTDNDYYRKCIDKSPFIKDRTKRTYLTAFNAIIKLLKQDKLHEIIFNPKKYGEMLYAKASTPEVRKAYLTAILALLKYSDVKTQHQEIFFAWYTLYLKARKELVHNLINHIPSDRQKMSHMEWEDILKFADEVAKKEPGSKDHLLFSLLTMIPPRRQLDWYKVKIHTTPNSKPKADHNYINLGWHTPYILLVEYKTADYYKNWYRKIPGNLLQVMRLSLKQEPRDFLFVDRQGKEYKNAEAFASWSNRAMKRITGNPMISMNTFRHSFVSYIRRVKPHMSLKEQYQISRDMGHSIVQNMGYDVNRQPTTNAAVSP